MSFEYYHYDNEINHTLNLLLLREGTRAKREKCACHIQNEHKIQLWNKQ